MIKSFRTIECTIELTVNGETVRETVEPRMSLVDFLRERLGLTGSHVGCEQGVCGACTVRLDGVTARGCLVLAVQCAGSKVETIEGVSDAGEIADLQDAFVRRNALQCGFCTPGMLLAAQELLAQCGMPGRQEIRAQLSGNYCRCTGYQAIVDAVEAVARARRETPACRPPPQERAAGESGDKPHSAASSHHARSPSAIRPSPCVGGCSRPLDEQLAGRPRSQGAP